MNELRIRKSEPHEAERLFAIQKAASVAAFGDVFPPERYPYPDDAVRERWRTFLTSAEASAIVAELEGEPVGVAAVRRGWLDGFYVLPEYWGVGVAPPLHDAALERIRELGSSEARLWVLEANFRARRFYERRGWTLNGETRIVPYPPNPLDVGYSRPLAG